MPSASDARDAIRTVRGERVVLDGALATFFGTETKRLNEQVKRNAEKFEGYAFQLTEAEFAALRSQDATAKPGRGGRRSPPWAFTEHGVVMAATVLSSDAAIRASRHVVEAFVASKTAAPGGALARLNEGFLPELRTQLAALMRAQVNPKEAKTLRDETEEFISEGLGNLKARLRKAGLENEEVEARVLKTLAEAEEARARAATEREMTERQRIKNQANVLRLMIRAELAITDGELDAFLVVLDELGGA